MSLSHPWWRCSTEEDAPFRAACRVRSPLFRGGNSGSHYHCGPAETRLYWTESAQAFSGGNSSSGSSTCCCNNNNNIVHGASGSGRQPAATAWYNLTYDLPKAPLPPESLSQPYNLPDDVGKSDITLTNETPIQSHIFVLGRHVSNKDSVSSTVAAEDGNREKNDASYSGGGIRDQMEALRRRIEAVEAQRSTEPQGLGAIGIAPRKSEGRDAAPSSGAAAPSVSAPPVPLSGEAQARPARAATPPPTAASVTPTEGVTRTVASATHIFAPPSPPLTTGHSDGITLERLMRAVRSARERAKQQQQQES
ncbi:hypothetical protein DQ04_05391020 [Trypanosoma grayi]|uniref:hypothetical protein n=1 Tax=Trypanosoma grayi TaxID=71804 RepID=UPI0004F4990A|nr:hypothetical protein DQ04_05391020 [Trypanosoma grayi]KEG09333.1 hypothetical protein DQ04_05391020 [Trypanosoma grayi]